MRYFLWEAKVSRPYADKDECQLFRLVFPTLEANAHDQSVWLEIQPSFSF